MLISIISCLESLIHLGLTCKPKRWLCALFWPSTQRISILQAYWLAERFHWPPYFGKLQWLFTLLPFEAKLFFRFTQSKYSFSFYPSWKELSPKSFSIGFLRNHCSSQLLPTWQTLASPIKLMILDVLGQGLPLYSRRRSSKYVPFSDHFEEISWKFTYPEVCHSKPQRQTFNFASKFLFYQYKWHALLP